MTLNKRERVMAIAVGAVLLIFVGWFAFGSATNPFSDLNDQKNSLTEELTKRTAACADLRKAKQRLDEMLKQSLPSDPVLARNRYQEWLRDQVQQVSFEKLEIERTQEESQQDFKGFTISFRCQGSLGQLTEFLQKFYSAGHLQLIKRLGIKPVEKSSKLEFSMVIGAISLPTVDRKGELSKEPGKRLAFADVAAYKPIAERNMFAPPPPPVVQRRPVEPRRDPPPPAFDPSKHAIFTGIVEGVDGQPEAWLRSRTTDEQFKLRSGDPVRIGPFRGQVGRIEAREVEVIVDGKSHIIPLGENLRSGDGKSVATEPKPEPKPEMKPEMKPEPGPAKDAKLDAKPPAEKDSTAGPSESSGRDRRRFNGRRSRDSSPRGE